jgi:hypothetical protein
MVVDALDLSYTKGHVDTFVIISGDSDFSPLVSKLRENAKTVIGVGVKNSTSDLFINNCDEFIYYDDLVRKLPSKSRRRSAPAPRPASITTENAGAGTPGAAPAMAGTPGAVQAVQTAAGTAAAAGSPAASTPAAGTPVSAMHVTENKGPDPTDALDLVVETLEAVVEERGESEPIWGSMIKQAIKRRHPGFNERAYGFRSFNELLSDAQKRGLLTLRADEKSGGYTVRVVERALPR